MSAKIILKFLFTVATLTISFLGTVKNSAAQALPEAISISGKVADAENSSASFPVLMIVNMTTQRGFFANADGTFTTVIGRKDTLAISATGYALKKMCFKDSLMKDNFQINILIKKLEIDLKTVDVFPQRDLDKIERDIQKLGYNERDYQLKGIDAWSAPLEALYQEFSKKEQDRRRAAQLRNDARRHDLLKELLRMYEKNNLVKLPYEKYDDFISYLQISDDMMKYWTQYELAIYIKSKYERYRF